ncbi:hypothetical protein LTR53_003250 [Teratosphaeriaceae sp. CCFEE 6253]|nr:hypothetical protein LTR53_003250 [Teratosphaeriaceae sp. CCFEE 6253]
MAKANPRVQGSNCQRRSHGMGFGRSLLQARRCGPVLPTARWGTLTRHGLADGTHIVQKGTPLVQQVCCFDPESAILAAEAGADRIELCDDREAGGTTPPLAWLRHVQRHVRIPVFVMIRPRSGDFNYTTPEFDRMKHEITALKPQADGFVFGILHDDWRVNVAWTAELVKLAAPLPCTFHKAFDETPDLLEALEDVLAAGCSAILTSGGAHTALAGMETLGQLVRMSRRRITIMPGGGVRSGNVATLRAFSRANVFHSSAVPKGQTSPSSREIRELKAALRVKTVRMPLLVDSSSPNGLQSSNEGGAESASMLTSAVSIGDSPDHDP